LGKGLAVRGRGGATARRAGAARVPRPFLKWAGGKGQLLAEIIRRLPPDKRIVRYIEPFVGGGALFFWIRDHFPQIPCRIADRNAPLIDTYQVTRDCVEELVAALRSHAEAHSAEHYYAVRRSEPSDAVERAARFIYLNRTCYNGLWRVNRGGRFNVPLGRYKNPRIVDEDNLRSVSTALQGVEIVCQDFEEAVSGGGPGDFVYFDPPYQPLSSTSHFTAYTSEGFDLEAQKRLARTFETLNRDGAFLILSNSDVEDVRGLYRNLFPRPILDRVRVSRPINSNGERRGAVSELLIYTSSRNGGPR
jgi:DNA adenine methylase